MRSAGFYARSTLALLLAKRQRRSRGDQIGKSHHTVHAGLHTRITCAFLLVGREQKHTSQNQRYFTTHTGLDKRITLTLLLMESSSSLTASWQEEQHCGSMSIACNNSLLAWLNALALSGSACSHARGDSSNASYSSNRDPTMRTATHADSTVNDLQHVQRQQASR